TGWMSRHGITGAIGIRTQEEGEGLVCQSDKDRTQLERKSPWMTEIRLIGNTVEHSKEGVVAKGTRGMRVEGNTFIGVEKPMDMPKEENPDVVIEGNQIK